MFFKAALFICAQALVMQSISGQCCGAGWAAPYRSAGCCGAAPSFSGGSLPVTSASPYAPNGVSVLSENSYCGELTVCGALPFLGTVGLQGELPTAGSGTVQYGCGNGEVAILNENYAGAGLAGGYGYGAGCGCGCGRY